MDNERFFIHGLQDELNKLAGSPGAEIPYANSIEHTPAVRRGARGVLGGAAALTGANIAGPAVMAPFLGVSGSPAAMGAGAGLIGGGAGQVKKEIKRGTNSDPKMKNFNQFKSTGKDINFSKPKQSFDPGWGKYGQ